MSTRRPSTARPAGRAGSASRRQEPIPTAGRPGSPRGSSSAPPLAGRDESVTRPGPAASCPPATPPSSAATGFRRDEAGRPSTSGTDAPGAGHGAGHRSDSDAVTGGADGLAGADLGRRPDHRVGRLVEAALDRIGLGHLVHRVAQVVRYGAVSIVATLTSTTVLGVLVATATLTPGWANIVATGVGTVPSFELNRRWVWGRTGRRSVTTEIGPFCILSFAGLAVSTAAVSAAGRWAGGAGLPASWRTAVILVANVAAFGSLWVLQFLLLDRVLFARRGTGPRSGGSGAAGPKPLPAGVAPLALPVAAPGATPEIYARVAPVRAAPGRPAADLDAGSVRAGRVRLRARAGRRDLGAAAPPDGTVPATSRVPTRSSVPDVPPSRSLPTGAPDGPGGAAPPRSSADSRAGSPPGRTAVAA